MTGKTPKKRGRRWVISEAIINNAAGLIKRGNYANTVCDYLGIHESTWYRWLNTGQELKESGKAKLTKEEELQIKFFEEIKKASARAEMDAIDEIKQAGRENWTASAWYLERRFGERWGKKDKIEHSGGLNNTNKNIDLSNLSDEELQKELDKYKD